MRQGATTEKLKAVLADSINSPVLSEREGLALELADLMTHTDRRVTEPFFRRLQQVFSDEELVELAAVIALENFRSKFNPVFGVEANGFCALPAVQEAVATATRRFSE
jgi:alkylhydroperoxidase family enzyme